MQFFFMETETETMIPSRRTSKLFAAGGQGRSVRINVPNQVLQLLGIGVGDRLAWIIKTSDKGVVITVSKAPQC
jgi:hypothetical protein